MEDQLFLVKWEATPIGSDAITNTGVVQVFGADPKQASRTVFNIMRVTHPEFGTLRCTTLQAIEQAPAQEAPTEEKPVVINMGTDEKK